MQKIMIDHLGSQVSGNGYPKDAFIDWRAGYRKEYSCKRDLLSYET